MEYNPDFHAKQDQPWTEEDDDYLMKYYKFDGLKMLSFAFERTEAAVCARYHKLKARGYKVND